MATGAKQIKSFPLLRAHSPTTIPLYSPTMMMMMMMILIIIILLYYTTATAGDRRRCIPNHYTRSSCYISFSVKRCTTPPNRTHTLPHRKRGSTVRNAVVYAHDHGSRRYAAYIILLLYIRLYNMAWLMDFRDAPRRQQT